MSSTENSCGIQYLLLFFFFLFNSTQLELIYVELLAWHVSFPKRNRKKFTKIQIGKTGYIFSIAFASCSTIFCMVSCLLILLTEKNLNTKRAPKEKRINKDICGIDRFSQNRFHNYFMNSSCAMHTKCNDV